MRKSPKKDTATLEIGLKTEGKRSHNKALIEAQIKALVRHMARRAAEEDFKMYEDALRSQGRETDRK